MHRFHVSARRPPALRSGSGPQAPGIGLRPPATSLRPLASLGFTLIEMLVSLAITLIMMAAVVSLFGLISDSVSGSRSIIEMSERLRAARNRLQADLNGATAPMLPSLRPESDQGYFEIIEGPSTDATYATTYPTVLGDADDVLMFTVRSRGEPFVGRFGTTTVESQVAEVMYYCASDPNGYAATLFVDSSGNARKLYTLYRRVLLVSPGLAANMPAATNSYYDNYDVSARYLSGGTPSLVPNTLGDLTKREYRFAHLGLTYPPLFPFDVQYTMPGGYPNTAPSNNATLSPTTGARLGDDVLLTNVLAFDVQVYDPLAQVRQPSGGGAALTESDVGFSGGTPMTYTDLGGSTVNVVGAYVDLGLGAQFGAPQSVAGASTALVPNLPSAAGTFYTYDTWSLHYENNGIDEDDGGSGPTDEGTNGLDDNATGGVDDPSEYETQPPYPYPLRGIKITIRVYEPGSQQVRQATIVEDFLPE